MAIYLIKIWRICIIGGRGNQGGMFSPLGIWINFFVAIKREIQQWKFVYAEQSATFKIFGAGHKKYFGPWA